MKADNYHTDVQWFDLLDATRVSVSEGVPFRHGELYQKKKKPLLSLDYNERIARTPTHGTLE